MEHEQNIQNQPISMLYADAKTSTVMAVRNVMKAFPLPIFMFESILESALLEIRNEAKMELSRECQNYGENMKQTFEKEKQELVDAFENNEGEMEG